MSRATLSTFTLLLLFGTALPSRAAVLIPIGSVSTNGAVDTFSGQTPAVLVNGAQGDYNYNAPNPGSGGGGTSWHTYTTSGSPPLVLTFNFSSTSAADEVVLWDYYGHTPNDWTVKLFSGLNAGGLELLSADFSIAAGGGDFYTPGRWNISFPTTLGVNSAQLLTRSNSHWGGVGLAEVAFVQATIVPAPASGMVVALVFAIFGGWSWVRRRNAPPMLAS
jgi:hypothetical protein